MLEALLFTCDCSRWYCEWPPFTIHQLTKLTFRVYTGLSNNYQLSWSKNLENLFLNIYHPNTVTSEHTPHRKHKMRVYWDILVDKWTLLDNITYTTSLYCVDEYYFKQWPILLRLITILELNNYFSLFQIYAPHNGLYKAG